jgi:tetratricopeptide (TPR) repeat protein
MKKYLLITILITSHVFCFAQTDKVKVLVNEGVTLHDKGEYESALKKYDEAIAADASYINSFYEKSYTLYAMKKLEECIDLSKQIIKHFPDDELLKGVFVHYGSALDDLGKPENAIKVYNEGLKKFPNYFLLNFNKGVTYLVMKEDEKAYPCFQDALITNPFHASSYYQVAGLIKSSNHIPAILSFIMHLVLEPKTERSVASFNALKELMYGNVKKTGDNNVTITMDASMFDTKKTKKQPDNFRMQEMLFTMSSALDKDSVMNSVTKTDIEKFDLKLQLLINSLKEGEKGFFSERYVSFFKKVKENNFTMIVSRLVFTNTNDERNAAWLKTNTAKTDEFYKWLKEYQWPKQ